MSYLVWPWTLVVLVIAFAHDLVMSSLQVARVVLTPGIATRPCFAVVPLAQARSDLEISVVANYITLTPGTLTVDASADRATLLVHALSIGESTDEVRADICEAIEPRVVRALRP